MAMESAYYSSEQGEGQSLVNKVQPSNNIIERYFASMAG